MTGLHSGGPPPPGPDPAVSGAAGGKKGANPNKWQAQISSGFDALIGFASSELDRSKEMRRKSVDSNERSPSHGGYGSDPSTVQGIRNKNGGRAGMHAVGSSAPESALRAALSGGFDRPPCSSSSNNNNNHSNIHNNCKVNSNHNTNEARSTPVSSSSSSSSSSNVTNTDKPFPDAARSASSFSGGGLVHVSSSPKRNKSPLPPQAGPGSTTKKARSRSSSTESQNKGGRKGSTPQKSRSPSPSPHKDTGGDSGRQSPQDYSKYDKHFKKKFFGKDYNRKKQTNNAESTEGKDSTKDTSKESKKEKRYGKFKWKGKDWEKRNSDKSTVESDKGTTDGDKDSKPPTEGGTTDTGGGTMEGNTSRSSSRASASGGKDNGSSSGRSSAFTPQPPRVSSSGSVSQSSISMSTPPPQSAQFSFGSGVGLPGSFGGLRSAGFGEPPQLARTSPHLAPSPSGHLTPPASSGTSQSPHTISEVSRAGQFPSHLADRGRIPPGHVHPDLAAGGNGRPFDIPGRMPVFGDLYMGAAAAGFRPPLSAADLSHRPMLTGPGLAPYAGAAVAPQLFDMHRAGKDKQWKNFGDGTNKD